MLTILNIYQLYCINDLQDNISRKQTELKEKESELQDKDAYAIELELELWDKNSEIEYYEKMLLYALIMERTNIIHTVVKNGTITKVLFGYLILNMQGGKVILLVNYVINNRKWKNQCPISCF